MLIFEDRAAFMKLRGALARLAMVSSLGLLVFLAGGCAAGRSYRSVSYPSSAQAPPPSAELSSAPGTVTVTTSGESAPSPDNEGGSYGGRDEEVREDSSPEPQSPSAPPPPSPVPGPRAARPAVTTVRPPRAGPERAAVSMNGATGRGPATNPGANTGTPNNPTPQTPQVPAVQAPMLIYVAEVQMQTPRGEISATIERVIEAATSIGGYLVRRTDDMVQVRVPSQRFRESLARVESFGEVLHRSVSADDVSEEYRDVEVRLQNFRAVRRRLEEFLARATTMQDALTVEHELERVTREIDTLEGRLRFLGARVAFSLVTVHVSARPEHVDVAAPEPSATRRLLNLPVEWLSRLGLDRLMDVGSHE